MFPSRSVKQIGTFLMALFGGLAVALGPATAASAHPEVTSLNCLSSGGTFSCSLTYTGGIEPVTIKWYYNDVYRSQWNNRTSVWGTCAIHQYYSIKVTLTDIGGTSSKTSRFYCLGYE